MTAEYQRLRVYEIEVDKGFNVRQQFDSAQLGLLVRSLETDGQDAAVTVNRDAEGRVHLIDGERRLRAARNAGMEEIECKVYHDLAPVEALKKHLRSDVHKVKLNPMEQAAGMARLVENGLSVPDTAEFFDVSDDTVRRRLRLLELPAEVQKMMTRPMFALPIRQAEYIATLPASEAIQVARQAAPKTGPVAGEEWVKAAVDEIKKGKHLDGMEAVPASRKDRREQKKQAAAAAVRPAPEPVSGTESTVTIQMPKSAEFAEYAASVTVCRFTDGMWRFGWQAECEQDSWKSSILLPHQAALGTERAAVVVGLSLVEERFDGWLQEVIGKGEDEEEACRLKEVIERIQKTIKKYQTKKAVYTPDAPEPEPEKEAPEAGMSRHVHRPAPRPCEVHITGALGVDADGLLEIRQAVIQVGVQSYSGEVMEYLEYKYHCMDFLPLCGEELAAVAALLEKKPPEKNI